MKTCRKPMLPAAFVLAAALCWSLAAAQEETASLNGHVTDPDGLAVAGVKVQALNTGTNVSYWTDTNERGFFTFPTLPTGTYNVTAAKDGFRQAVRPGVGQITTTVTTARQIQFALRLIF